MKSKKQLFLALDDIFDTDEYSKKGLNHVLIGDETYGRKSCVYITQASPALRKVLDEMLEKRGFKVNRGYWPGGSVSEVQVSYFKGTNWDE